ncbi:transcription factor 21-like [Lytechinus pictus]|uniref:transcription factor 21-like n=1 Tax=Lytechinus pictus TaxID=7653 RepID=UPI0030B9B035
MLPGFEFIPIITEDSQFNETDFDQGTMPINNNVSGRHQDSCSSGCQGGDSESVSGESIASDRSPPSSSCGAKHHDTEKPAAGNGSGRRRRGGGKGGGDDGRGSSRGPIKPVQRNAANARERARMRVLSKAFSKLKTSLPWVPPDTKLSKLDTLRLASSYISHLKKILDDDSLDGRMMHPISLTWPFAITNKPTESDDQDNGHCDVMDTCVSSPNQKTDEDGGWCT